MKLIFCMQININQSYKLIPLILVRLTRPGQITQNDKFAKSLQDLKKEVRDEVDFLCRWASQFSINRYYHFWWLWPGMPKLLKITSMQCLCSISTINWVMKLMFCMLIFYKLIVLLLMGLARHAQITRVNLQYLWEIVRKKSGMKLGT